MFCAHLVLHVLTPSFPTRRASYLGCLAGAAKCHEAIAIDLRRSLADGGDTARGAQAIAEGLALGGYQYTTFKSKSEPSKLTRAAIVGGGGKRTQTAIDKIGRAHV